MTTIQKSGAFLATAVFSLSLLVVGCSDDFLEQDIPGTLGAEQLSSPAALEQVLLGAYSQLSGAHPTPDGGFNRFGGAYDWVTGSIQGGESNKGTEPGDLVDINQVVEYNLTPTSLIPDRKFQGLYRGVATANEVIKLTNASIDPNLTSEIRDNIIGQALFLRSHYYFQLAKHFNRFPYYDETVSTLETIEIANEDNMDRVMADMARAADLLPGTQLDAIGRANKWAAKAYLGKMQLHAGQWENARTAFNEVITDGTTSGGIKYALLLKFSQNFNAAFDNSSESIFAIQAAANTGSIINANAPFDLSHLQGTDIGGCCGFWQPSFDLVDSYRTSDDGLPLLDGSYRNEENRVKSDLDIESADPFTPDEGNLDPRLDHSVGRRGIPYLDWGPHLGKLWVRNQEHAGPYSPIKFIYPQSQAGSLQDGSSWTGGYTAINFNIIRFADVILMAAEANAQLGDLEAARELVNQIRTRAENSEDFVVDEDGSSAANYVISTYDDAWTNQANALDAIYFERKLELSNEGLRFFDLVRWGIAEEYLNSYIAFEKTFLPIQFNAANFSSPQDMYFPVPQSQLDLQSGILTQNPGY